jgi:hypothetical protein
MSARGQVGRVREFKGLWGCVRGLLMGVSMVREITHPTHAGGAGYRKWEQQQRRVGGPAAALRVIQREPEAVMRALG